MTADAAVANPLLNSRPLNQLPDFAALAPEQAEPAIDQLIAANRAALSELLERQAQPSWTTLIEPLEQMGEVLSQAWGPVSHLFGVRATAGWRAAFNACLPKITEYSVEISQSEPLYQAYLAIARSTEFRSYGPARRKVINDALRDFKLSGIALPPAQKEQFKELSLRLSELQTKFEEHLMDAIQAWSKQVTDETQLAGMSESARQAAREKAQAKNLDGWLLTLDFPSYDAVITYADNRVLRQEIYTAYATRASDQGPQAGQFDNGALIDEILALRHHLATAEQLAPSDSKVPRRAPSAGARPSACTRTRFDHLPAQSACQPCADRKKRCLPRWSTGRATGAPRPSPGRRAVSPASPPAPGRAGRRLSPATGAERPHRLSSGDRHDQADTAEQARRAGPGSSCP